MMSNEQADHALLTLLSLENWQFSGSMLLWEIVDGFLETWWSIGIVDSTNRYKQTTSQHGRSLAATRSNHPTWPIVNFRGAERNDPGPSRKIWMTCLFPSFVRNAKAAVPELLSNGLERCRETRCFFCKKNIKQRSSTANVCYWWRL